ncbi:hypothetical protein [uncultured Croceitalea sp.]|uniref:hypothetical protein n=1 Tax=uncultured Croceitalea sp. TaxID=1798908 RepID=UPI003305C456
MNDLTDMLKLEKGYLTSSFSKLDDTILLRFFSLSTSSNRSIIKIAKDLLSLELKGAKSTNETYSKYDEK